MKRKQIFRMEGILSIRRYEEKEKQLELAAVVQKIQSVAQAKERARTEQQRLAEEKRSFDFQDYTTRSLYYAALGRSIKNLNDKRAALNEELRPAERDYYAAKGRRKAIEALKERREQEQRKEESKKEQFHIEESGTRFWMRHHL